MTKTLLRWTLLTTLALVLLPGCNSAERERQAQQAIVNELLRKAKDYRAQGLEDSAFAMFGQALLENPRVVDAHMGIGDIYKARGDYDKAWVRFEYAAALDPTNYNAHYNLGVCKQVLGDLPYAIRSYRRALNLKPKSAEVNRGLASAYLQTGKSGLALAYAERATELDPDSFDAWANLGFIYVNARRYNDAVAAFRSAAELVGKDNDIDPVLLGLADAHIRLGNYTRAQNTLNALINRKASSTAYERRGVTLFKLRRYEDALKDFKRAVKMDPKDTAALNGLGVAYMTLYIEGGRDNTWQRDQALKAWSISLEINPKQQSIVTLVTRYKNI